MLNTCDTHNYLIIFQGMELSGIQCVAATGSKIKCNAHTWTRDEAIDVFMNPSMNYRVLFISSVGNAGLNLHAARFMIFAVSV